MKKIIFPILTLVFTSCVVPNFYQVYKTNVEDGIVGNNNIVFEDKNCLVYYNLSTEGGDVGFSIYNKTESDMTVYLTKTFFVLNGVAYEYFQNRTFSISSNSGTTVSSYYYPNYWNNNVSKTTGMSSTGFSTSYVEKPELTIPPKTLVNISEYKVTNTYFSNCDLPLYPSQNNIKSIKYSKEDSPFTFYNIITYSTKSDTVRLENKFYVSEIANFPSNTMFNRVDTSFCGYRLEFPVEVFKKLTPDRFYIMYTRDR
jgi:hypothetical protein